MIVYKSSMPFVSGDDIYFYGMLLTQGSLWHGLGMDMGRFFPLAGWNHSLVAAFSINPYVLMLGNAFIFCDYSDLLLCFGTQDRRSAKMDSTLFCNICP
ncbi:hypothetical protein [Helicobacter fennelliae]|uniref:hypothetical protein n=1 Tax=Helicobacter fennelliae TaxID=215 RepID=UPI0011C05AF3|nr:hypothetical protein [Helicobacter fennelliae]